MSGSSSNQFSRVYQNLFGGAGPGNNIRRLVDTFHEAVDGYSNKDDLMGCTLSGLGALYEAVNSQPDVFIGDRRFRILQGIGEGGFAFVYLVKEVRASRGGEGTGGWSERAKKHRADDDSYALKKVIIQSKEQLQQVTSEIEAASKFDHPALLPLIDHAIINVQPSGKEAYLLFPVYREGTLHDLISWVAAPQEQQPGPEKRRDRLPPAAVLRIFSQMCAGVAHMHSVAPIPYAHNDLKPGNVLISRKNRSLSIAIMDFGSARPARRRISNRSEALALQDWAAEHCTAAYRAPEFFDCPSQIDIDERSDVWSLGCCLYALMYGQSPFDFALGESGGSLQLAVMSGQIKWPQQSASARTYPPPLHELVTWMLQMDLSSRPFVHEVLQRVNVLKQELATAQRSSNVFR